MASLHSHCRSVLHSSQFLGAAIRRSQSPSQHKVPGRVSHFSLASFSLWHLVKLAFQMGCRDSRYSPAGFSLLHSVQLAFLVGSSIRSGGVLQGLRILSFQTSDCCALLSPRHCAAPLEVLVHCHCTSALVIQQMHTYFGRVCGVTSRSLSLL